MDADDKSHKDRLLIQYNYLENNLDVTACGTGMEIFGRSSDRYIPYYLSSEEIEIAFIEFNCFTIALMRLDFLRKHKISYNADFIYAEDYKLYTDIIKAGGKLVNIPQVLYYYRQHTQQITSNNLEQIAESSLKNQKELIDYLIRRDKIKYKDILAIHSILEKLHAEKKISIDDHCKVMRVLIKSN